MVSLYKVENGELVFKDRGVAANEQMLEAYGRQGYFCIFEPPPIHHLIKIQNQNKQI